MPEGKHTPDIVNAFFKGHYPDERASVGIQVFPRMECADGFTMSVQGHRGAYCSPRTNYADRYTQVEVGFPSEREELLMPYIEGDEDTDPTETVYGFVPVSIIEEVIAKLGMQAITLWNTRTHKEQS